MTRYWLQFFKETHPSLIVVWAVSPVAWIVALWPAPLPFVILGSIGWYLAFPLLVRNPAEPNSE